MAEIDILMATYNGEQYIKQQIESILSQTFCDFNLIISDDKSSDKTLEIINDYMKVDSRIRLYQNERNLGYNDNFMLLISRSNAPFFAIADQDDIWHNNQLQNLYDAITTHDVDIVYGKSGYINEENIQIKHRKYIKEIEVSDPYEIFEDNIVPGRNMMVNSRLKEQLFPYPDLSRQFIYDWYLTLKALENKGVYYINQEVNLYRVHTASVTNTNVYAPMRKKSFKEKVIYIEKLRQEAINTRIQRIEIFKSFLNDQSDIEMYKSYIKQLSHTKFINFDFLSFNKFMKIRTPYYKVIFLIILHFPILYRVFALKTIKGTGNNNEN